MRFAIPMAAGFGLTILSAGGALAGSAAYCVSCTGPDRSYTCRVDTSKANPGVDALQFYCIVKTAKAGGHKSCTARRQDGTACKGAVKTFTYKGPTLSPRARKAARKVLGPAPNAANDRAPEGAEKGEPKTLLEMGSRAVKASRKGLRNTGQAVRKAAGRTGQAIGKATKKAGKRVTGAARKSGGAIGTATKKAGTRVRGATRNAGSRVGNAARTAYDCVRSMFRDCRSRREDRQSADQGGGEPAAAPAVR